MIPEAFSQFVAVDWSGAKGQRLKGLQMALCGAGHEAPKLVTPSAGDCWTREGVWAWIVEQTKFNGPLLAAFDMALGMAYCDKDAYFPGLSNAPRTVRQLWRAIDQESQRSPDWYAGAFCSPPSPYAPYFNSPSNRGAFFKSRQRVTERVCHGKWTRPSSVCNAVGPGAVGMGSLAGMRMLHHIRKTKDLKVAIWPFNDVVDADIIVVEMFPRLYVKQAGMNPQLWREMGFLQAVWRAYGIRGRVPKAVETEDKMDALLSAAAIRWHAQNPEVWRPAGMTMAAARHEGWIFGVG